MSEAGGETPKATNGGNDSEGAKQPANLASVGMLLAPLIAALGLLALTGTIGRVQRDEPRWFTIAVGLVIASGAIWVAAATFTAPKGDQSRSWKDIVLRSIAFVLAAGGFILALGVAISTADNEPRPQITPTLSEDGTKLTTEVVASNLPTNHRLAFRVNLLDHDEYVSSPYRSYMGPDSDGKVEQTVTITLPESGYTEIEVKAFTGTPSTSSSCDDFGDVLASKTFGSGTGCVIIAVPPDPKPDQGDPDDPNGGGGQQSPKPMGTD